MNPPVTAHRPLTGLDERGRASLFTEARTPGAFVPVPVDDDVLRSVWDLARWAPTSSNAQPLRVLYVRTKDGRDRLLRHVAAGNRASTASAPVTAVLAEDTGFHRHLPHVFPGRPALAGVYEDDPALREASARYNTALQTGYFILAVRAHGLAAGPVEGFDKAGLDAEFFPRGRCRASLLVNIGHPDRDSVPDRLPRLPHEEVVWWA